MPATKSFADSNILLYLLSSNTEKAERAEHILASSAIVSVQVLNEITNVMRRKAKLTWAETNGFLASIRTLCPVVPLTVETHDKGRQLAQRYKLSVYDAMIVAAAVLAGCSTLYSEDMQDGLMVDRLLKIVNPFAA